MTNFHKDLTPQHWFDLSLMEQMANIGADVMRAIKHRNAGELNRSRAAFWRALELFDLTIDDPKSRIRLKEILRARECVVDYLDGENEYGSTDANMESYFYFYNYAARAQAGKI